MIQVGMNWKFFFLTVTFFCVKWLLKQEKNAFFCWELKIDGCDFAIAGSQ